MHLRTIALHTAAAHSLTLYKSLAEERKEAVIHRTAYMYPVTSATFLQGDSTGPPTLLCPPRTTSAMAGWGGGKNPT